MTVYGRPHIWDPSDVERIARGARGVCAIRQATVAEPEFSGVLIAPDLVLTCFHGVRAWPAPHRQFRFRFGPEVDPNADVSLTDREYGQVAIEAIGRKLTGFGFDVYLDFALLRLAPDEASGRPAGTDHPVAALSRRQPVMGDNLYVIGFPHLPGRPVSRKIRDDCRLLFQQGPSQSCGAGNQVTARAARAASA